MSLELVGLGFAYGDTRVLESVDFKLGAGEVVGLVGPNGAGKSTVIRLLTRVLEPRSGEIRVDGVPVPKLSRLELARTLAVVPQLNELPEAFSAHDIVLMGRTPHLGFFTAERPEDFSVAERAMRRTDTWDFRHRAAAELSGGERQRVLLARALAQEPRYLLLDEPTNHLDLRFQAEVLRFTRLEVARGLGALTVLHDLNLAARVCDRLLVLHGGRIVAEGPPQAVLSVDLIREVYGADVTLFHQPGDGTPVIMPTI